MKENDKDENQESTLFRLSRSKSEAIESFYEIPEIDSKPIPLSKSEMNFKKIKTTYYLGSDGTVFDLHYNIVKNQALNEIFNKSLEFPNVEDFNDYNSFENACIEWMKSTQKIVSRFHLPQIVGRSYFKPQENIPKNKFMIPNHKDKDETESEMPLESENTHETDTKFENENGNETGNETEKEIDLEIKIEVEIEKAFSNQNPDFSFEDEENSKEQKLKLLSIFEGRNKELMEKFEKDGKFLSQEPWHSQLFPQEPHLQRYIKFDHFSRAYRRWAQIVISSLNPVPLHAMDFESQIKLQTNKEKANSKKEESQSQLNENQSTVQQQTWRSKIYQSFIPYSLDSSPNLSLKVNRGRNNSNVCTFTTSWKEQSRWIRSTIQDSMVQIMKKTKKEQTLTRPIIGKLHGVLRGHGTSSRSFNKISSSVLMLNENLGPWELLRMDCVPIIDGESIEFFVPSYNLKEKFDLYQVKDDKEYLTKLKQQIEEIDFGNQIDSYCAWNFPSKFRKNFNLEQEKIIENVLKQDEFNYDSFWKILNTPQLFDKFVEMLDSNKFMHKKIPLKELLIEFLRKNYRKKLKECLLENQSRLTKMKIAKLIEMIFENYDFINELLSENDIQVIYLVAYSLSLMIPYCKKVFPFFPEIYHQIQIKFKDEKFLNFIHKIWIFDYLKIIYEATQSKNIRSIIKSMIDYEKIIIEELEKNIDFLIGELVKGLDQRSPTISSIFLYLLIQILELQDERIVKIFEKNGKQIVFHFRKAAKSKFTHTQLAAKYLWNRMKEDRFINFFTNKYVNDMDQVINDLFENQKTQKSGKPEKKESKQLNAKLRSSTILHNPLQMMDKKSQSFANLTSLIKSNEYFQPDINPTTTTSSSSTLTKNQEKSANYWNQLINKRYYHRFPFLTHLFTDFFGYIYQQISKGVSIVLNDSNLLSPKIYESITHQIFMKFENYDEDLIFISKFLSEMIRCLQSLDLICAEKRTLNQKITQRKHSKNRNQNKNSSQKIQISTSQLAVFVQLIHKAPKNEYNFKINILNSLRYLLKEESIFNNFQNNISDLIPIIKIWCLDEGNAEFNKTAFKTFYQIVSYHSNSIQYLIQNNLLDFLIEILTPHYKIYVTHCLYYFSKLFSMDLIEKNRIMNHKKPIRVHEKSPIKTAKRDVKILVQYFVKKHYFVRFHIMLQKFKGKNHENSGAPFILLGKIYQIIMFSPSCSKFFRSVKKEKTYEEGFAFFKQKLIPKSKSRK